MIRSARPRPGGTTAPRVLPRGRGLRLRGLLRRHRRPRRVPRRHRRRRVPHGARSDGSVNGATRAHLQRLERLDQEDEDFIHPFHSDLKDDSDAGYDDQSFIIESALSLSPGAGNCQRCGWS